MYGFDNVDAPADKTTTPTAMITPTTAAASASTTTAVTPSATTTAPSVAIVTELQPSPMVVDMTPPPVIKTQNKTKTKTESITKSVRSGLLLPVGRVNGKIHRGHKELRVSGTVPVMLTAVIETVLRELIKESVKVTALEHRQRISAKHVMQAIGTNQELDELFAHATMCHAGVFFEKKHKPKKDVKETRGSDSDDGNSDDDN